MTEPALGARRVRSLLDAYGVRPSKSRGQNFVIDPNTIRMLVANAAIGPDDTVLEIGPGAGSLTVALAASARRVVAVEVDPRLVKLLRASLAAPNVEVIDADALEVDLGSLGANRLVSNLPYAVAAPLVIHALQQAPEIGQLDVMTQREVGERLAARPGSRLYGRTSVVVSLYAEARVVANVSRRAFYPVPGVDSVVVRVRRRVGDLDVDPERFERVAHAAFAQRRKIMRNALAPLAGSVGAAERALNAAGIEPGVRAEAVDREGYIALARVL